MTKVTKISDPWAIYAEAELHPPLMRNEIWNNYIGKEVEWLLTFRNGSLEKGEARLMFCGDSHQLQMVLGTVALSDYPWLRSLASDERVRVRGRIRGIDSIGVKLDILELSIPAKAKVGARKGTTRN